MNIILRCTGWPQNKAFWFDDKNPVFNCPCFNTMVAWTYFKWHLRSFRLTHYVILNIILLRFTNEMTKNVNLQIRKTHTKWRSRWRNAWRKVRLQYHLKCHWKLSDVHATSPYWHIVFGRGRWDYIIGPPCSVQLHYVDVYFADRVMKVIT